MANTINALFGQDDEPENNEEIVDEITGDGQDDEIEMEASEEEPDVEVEEEETEEPSEETSNETETNEEDEAKLSPAEEKIARAAEGRLRALQDEREKRQNAERELQEMRNRMEQFERQQQQFQAQNIPDPNSDPYGYAEAVRQQYERQVVEQRFYMSDQMARQTHGAEKVEEAAKWATAQMQSNPNLQAVMFQQSDPLGWIVEQFDREQKVNRFLNDPDAQFKEWAEKNGYKPADQIVQPVMPVGQAPTTPIAKAPPKRAAAAQVASDAKRGGSDAPTSMSGILGLK